MGQFLNDTFWVWINIIAAVVLFGVTFYFTPKFVRFLDDFFNRKTDPKRKKPNRTKSERKNKKSL